MEATIVPDKYNHYPVLLKEIISIISLNMVAHLLIVLLVKVDIQKKYLNSQIPE